MGQRLLKLYKLLCSNPGMEDSRSVIPNWNAESSIYNEIHDNIEVIIPAQGRLGYPGWCENRCKNQFLQCIRTCYKYPTFLAADRVCLEKCANTATSCLKNCEFPGFPGTPP